MQKATALQLVDFYPFLRPLYRIIPARFSSYKRGLKEVREIENQLFIELLDDAKAKIEAGQVYPSQFLVLHHISELFAKHVLA